MQACKSHFIHLRRETAKLKNPYIDHVTLHVNKLRGRRHADSTFRAAGAIMFR